MGDAEVGALARSDDRGRGRSRAGERHCRALHRGLRAPRWTGALRLAAAFAGGGVPRGSDSPGDRALSESGSAEGRDQLLARLTFARYHARFIYDADFAHIAPSAS